MAGHVRVIAWLHVVFGALGLCVAVAMLVLFGGIAGLVGLTGHSPDARVAIPILGVVGSVLAFVIALVSLPGLIAGIGLLNLRPWARILTIILSALHLLNVPLGTALGVYSLWALLSAEGARLFEQPAVLAHPR
jgi:hypothetical protein